MSSMFMKAGEVICIASGIYEGYDRTGPFVVTREFDLEAFVDQAKAALSEPGDVSGSCMKYPECFLLKASFPRCRAEKST